MCFLSLHKSTKDKQGTHKYCIFDGTCVQHVVLIAAQIFSFASRMKAPAQQLHTYRHASVAIRSRMRSASYLPPQSHFSFLSLLFSSCSLIIPERSCLWGSESSACLNLISPSTSYVSWASFFLYFHLKSNIFHLLFTSGSHIHPPRPLLLILPKTTLL